MKKKITNRLLDLNELDGVTVTVSGPKKQTVRIQHTRAHVLDYDSRGPVTTTSSGTSTTTTDS